MADDPEIAAIRRGVMEDIERAGREPFRPDVPDPVLADILSGASVRELSAAHDDLARAHARYADAIRKGRAAGLSWGEIGRSWRLEAAAAPPLQPTRADNSSLSIRRCGWRVHRGRC